MIRLRHIAFAAVLAALGFAVLAPALAEAGDKIDCSSLKKWNKSTQYKEGNLVWGSNSDYNSAGSEYRCKPSSVYCSDPYEPKESSSEWTLVGACRSGTTPR